MNDIFEKSKNVSDIENSKEHSENNNRRFNLVNRFHDYNNEAMHC